MRNTIRILNRNLTVFLIGNVIGGGNKRVGIDDEGLGSGFWRGGKSVLRQYIHVDDDMDISSE
jgi:hypothetical protein